MNSTHSDLVSILSNEVLALLAASYNKPADQVVDGIVSRTSRKPSKPSKASKLAAIKAAKAAEVEAHPVSTEVKLPMVVIELLPLGTYDARGFFFAIRHAATRDEKIQAISGYVGYDRYGEFGQQELAATMRAWRDLHPITATGALPVHTALASYMGWVSGLPDETAKRLGDLAGRETMAAEEIADLDKQAKDHLERGDLANARLCTELAMVEKLRLAQIQADMSEISI